MGIPAHVSSGCGTNKNGDPVSIIAPKEDLPTLYDIVYAESLG